MKNWTPEQYDDVLKRKAIAAANGRTPDPVAVHPPELERPIRKESLGKEEIQGRSPTCIHVRVTSRRVWLLDDCNISAKYLVDLLRYSGVLLDDAYKLVRVENVQEKVKTRKEQETIIEIIP